MKLIVYVNDTFEEEKALFNLDDNTVLVKGDYYHDKIDERIEGFLEGLDYCDMSYELLESENVISKMDAFEKCGFYNEGEYDDDDKNDETENEDSEDDDETEDICESINAIEMPIIVESIPPFNNYNFYIYSSEYERGQKLYTQDILEAIERVRDCEGDLYDEDDIIYSCLGLNFNDNVESLKKYGVEYDEKLGFVKCK